MKKLLIVLCLRILLFPATAAAMGYGTAVDWTNGTGVCPSGGVISVTADTGRQWFFVQNRDVAEVTVSYTVAYANGTGTGTATVSLDPASASGGQGGTEERETEIFMPARGAISIGCTVGDKLTVLTSSGG